MKLSGKLALVTGGSAGIGLAITEKLIEAGSSVLVVGRDVRKLEAVRAMSSRIMTFEVDLADKSERTRLIEHIRSNERPLDILVNNAGIMQQFKLTEPDALARLDPELQLDLHAPIHLSTALLQQLLQRPEAAIVNVTTGLVYAPFGSTPGYSAAKGGLHAFTRSLRWQTRGTSLNVIELMPPTVDTELTTRYEGAKISARKVASQLIEAITSGKTVVRPGQTKALYLMSRIAPNFIFNALNKVADKAQPD